MDVKKQQALLAASVAGILAAVASGGAVSSQAGAHSQESGEKAPCYGINKCKGTGDCGGKGYSCAGNNACHGQGFIDLGKDVCLRIEGGRLTEEPAAS